MHPTITLRRALLAAATLALLATAGWALTNGQAASATSGTTTAVSGGPDTFQQATPTGAPSQYSSQLERCHDSPSYPLSGPNPILSEPLTTSFTSNVPLTVRVGSTGDQWWGEKDLIFTNRSADTPLDVDCAVIIFRAPSGSDDHSYSSTQPYGHPQQDYVEVPRGDGTSFYIARLGFHDVTLAQRVVGPGQSFTYRLGGADDGAISLEAIRDSIRFTADLDLAANTDLVKKYGTTRLTN